MKSYILAACSAAMMALATSCLSDGESTTDYVLQGSFDYLANYMEVFNADSVCFAEKISTDNYSWVNADYVDSIYRGGICVSMKKDSIGIDGSISDYCAAGPRDAAGAQNSSCYAVYTPSSAQYDWQIDISGFKVYSCIPSGFYIDNLSKTLKTIEDSPLEVGDYMKVTVTGYFNNASVGSTEVDLVRKTSDNTTVVSNWTPVELSMDEIDALRFTIETNRNDFPLSFCLDNLYFKVHLEN